MSKWKCIIFLLCTVWVVASLYGGKDNLTIGFVGIMLTGLIILGFQLSGKDRGLAVFVFCIFVAIYIYQVR